MTCRRHQRNGTAPQDPRGATPGLGRAVLRVAAMAAVLSVGVAASASAHAPGRDGRIAYSSSDDATGDSRILVSSPDGAHVRELSLPYPAFVPVWSPDGSRLLISVFGPHGVGPATVARDGSDFRLLSVPGLADDTNVYCRSWSPDATRLACELINFGGENADDGLYTLDSADGGHPRRLTVNPYPPQEDFGGGDLPGDFSPDGTQIVFMRARPEADPQVSQSGALFVVGVDGSGLRQITPYGLPNSHEEGVARWAPKGRRILFASEDGHVDLLRPDGTGLRQIRLRVPGPGYYAFTPDWSPDGKCLVFSLFRQDTGQVDLFTARRDGTRLRRVTDSPESEVFPTWSDPHALKEPSLRGR